MLALRGELSLIDGLFSAANGISAASQSINRICYGQWHGGHSPPEDVIYIRTAAAQAELHCHGGLAAVGRIIRDLSASGAVAGDASAQSRLEAELAQELTQATTRRTAHHLLNQCLRLPELFRDLQGQPADRQLAMIDAALAWTRFGSRLTRPWKVVLCGPPNVGKSSLMNALVGFSRAVVYDQPGTTRDVVTAETAFDGWPVVLSDTAGLRVSHDPLEAAGVERARHQLMTADQILIVLDGSRPLPSDAAQLLEDHPQATVVVNKSDLPRVLSLPDEDREVIRVSAVTGEGIADLTGHLSRTLVPCEPPLDTAFPVTLSLAEFLIQLRGYILIDAETEVAQALSKWLDA